MNEHTVLDEFEVIEVLGLSTRVYNALKRSRINTIGELNYWILSENLYSISNIGDNSVSEILSKMNKIKIINSNRKMNVHHSTDEIKEINVNPAMDFIEINVPQEIRLWLLEKIKQQIDTGVLHVETIVNNYTANETQHRLRIGSTSKVDFITVANSIIDVKTIEEELILLFDGLSEREIYILEGRSENTKMTLQQLAEELNVTRERVRQIEQKSKERILLNFTRYKTPLRIQTALLVAQDMGLDISFEKWKTRIVESGLLTNGETF